MKIKKVKIEVCKEFSPHNYIYRGPYEEAECDFRVNVFFGKSRYFFFYSGLFKKRRLKKNTWFYELILNRGRLEKEKSGVEYTPKPLMILEGVEKEEGRYKYKEVYVSAYLMRRLLEGSTKSESIKDLEVYEN